MADPGIPSRINHLCCSICSQVLRNPVTIPCGHNFCMRCIQGRWNNEEENNYTCSCPACSQMFPHRPPLIKNATLADLVRDTERCESGSEGRKRQHSGVSAPAGEKRGSCAQTGSPLCWRHNRSLDVYCCTDEKVICEVCAVAEHMGHTIGSVKLERKRRQEELKNIDEESRQILQKQEKKWKSLEKTLKKIQGEARKTEDYCESILVRVIDSLQRHYQSVREVIRGQEEATAAQVQIYLQTLQVEMEETKRRSAELDRLTQTDDDVCFLKEWLSLRPLCEKDHLATLRWVSEDPLVPFEFTKRAVEEVGRQLEELCDKEFASISQTGLSGVNKTLTEQTVEPKTRAEFLQYACDLSLDPTTAHEDLAISAGYKEVRLGPLKCKSPTVRSPERFIHRRQVLCREGLQAERCYYEVEVEGDKSEIALAYKGMDRKSRTSVSAFGGNANSWSLDRTTHYSVSHRGDSIQLTSPPLHHRIGVYLKFTQGTLCFYEVSDRMKFLYKVEDEFKEPLYPGFWLGEKCCIRICDLT